MPDSPQPQDAPVEAQRHERLRKAASRFLAEYDREAKEYGVPFNFALRRELRELRAALREETDP